MRMLKTLGAAIFAAALPCLAVAQTNPNLTNMQVLTPGQWNNLFASKQDTLGFTPMNSNGGTFLGRIVTAPPGASTSGLNLTPGTTPGSPANGDLWVTASSIFARVNGVTVDLVGSPCTNCALTTLANTFTASPQTVQGLTTTQPGWFAQLTGDTNARVRVGLNSTDIPSIAFGPGNAVRDAFIERLGAGSLRFGTMDAAAPVAQTFSVQNVLTGTSNTAGAALTIAGSRGTGTGAGGNVLFQVAPAGSSGSTQNALSTALTIFGADGGLSTGAATDQGAGTLNLAGLLYANGTAPTGTGGYARSTSPTFVTPALGTPTSGVLSTGVSLGGVTMALGSDANGDIYCRSGGVLTRIGAGASATLLTSGGAGVCPTWVAAPGGGNVSNSGTPTINQIAQWISSTQVAGVNLASLVTAGAGIGITGTTSLTIGQSLTNQTTQAQPTNAANVGAAVMMGYGVTGASGGCRITPTYSGRVDVRIIGSAQNSISAATDSITARFGTGAAPAYSASSTGTSIGPTITAAVAGTVLNLPFSAGGVVPGLTPGTLYWFDLFVSPSSGNATILNVGCTLIEY